MLFHSDTYRTVSDIDVPTRFIRKGDVISAKLDRNVSEGDLALIALGSALRVATYRNDSYILDEYGEVEPSLIIGPVSSVSRTYAV